MHIAELNIAEAYYPMDSAEMESFTSQIDAINAIADRSPGFVWRLVDDDPDCDGALGIRFPGAGEKTLVNMSVWDNAESLIDFMYNTVHAKIMARKDEWFTKMLSHHFVLWYVPEGHIPDLLEASEKLDHLNENGPSPAAFTFRSAFDADGNPIDLKLPAKVIN